MGAMFDAVDGTRCNGSQAGYPVGRQWYAYRGGVAWYGYHDSGLCLWYSGQEQPGELVFVYYLDSTDTESLAPI